MAQSGHLGRQDEHHDLALVAPMLESLEPRLLLSTGQIHVANSTDVAILDVGPIASTSVTTSGAPGNAVITSVDVHYHINHTFIGDLWVSAKTQGTSTWITRSLWSYSGGDDDVIDETETAHDWDGLSPNRTWILDAQDTVGADWGFITDFDVTVNWSAPDSFVPTFHDARISNKVDADGDGYARSFDVEFDVNSNISGNYYVKMYEYDGGVGDDYLMTSSTFSVNGSGVDYHGIHIDCSSFPGADLMNHGTAQFKLELYDSHTETLVQTWTPSNDASLGSLNVEQASDDTPFVPTFQDARITSKVDQDADGYARSLAIEVDVDSNVIGSFYVKVYEYDGGVGDDYLLKSSTFSVNGSVVDYRSISINCSNFPGVDLLGHGTADFKLVLYDAATNMIKQTWTLSNDASLGGVDVETATEDGEPVVNHAPSVTSLTAAPFSGVTIGQVVTLTARAGDPDGADGDSVKTVEFYDDLNGDGVADDTELLFTDSDGTDGWIYSWDTTLHAPGQVTLLAVASDQSDMQSTPRSLALTLNGRPVADPKSLTTDEDQALNGVLTGSDPDGDTLTFSLVSGPSHGSVTIQPNGAFIYTPAPDYNGADSFTVKANDGKADSAAVAVDIGVNAVNDAPTANSLTISTNAGTPVDGALTGGDVEGSPLAYAITSDPAHGTVHLKADGTFTYTPAALFAGVDSVTFRVNDGLLDSATSTVTINVGATLNLNAKGVATFTDASGDLVTVSLKGGGAGTLYFAHPGNCDLSRLVLSGTTAASSLTITTAGRGSSTTLGGLDTSGGLLKSVTAKTTDVTGTIAIGGSSSSAPVSLTFDQMADVELTSGAPIKSLKAKEWQDTDAVADQLTTPFVGTLTISGNLAAAIRGDFEADLNITGADLKFIGLKTLKVAGNIDADIDLTAGFAIVKSITAASWSQGQLNADVLSSLTVKGNMAADLNVEASIAKATISGNLSGNWDALSIGTATVKGNLQDATIVLHQASSPDPALKSINKLTVTGWIDGTRIDVKGNVGAISAGGVSDSSLFTGVASSADLLGADTDADGLPNPDGTYDLIGAGDLTPAVQYKIGKLTITGLKKDASGHSWINSNFAATSFGSVSLKYAALNNSAVPFGVAAHTIDSLSYVDINPLKSLSRRGLVAPGDLTSTDLVIRIL